jgi:hydrogenase expression/formation protein HypD
MADFNNAPIAQSLVNRIHKTAKGLGTVRIMEVCGTHTMAIGRFGIRQALPGNVRLISGPGCPLCVTPAGYIDKSIAIAEESGYTIATFGDMVRVPGIKSSLEEARTNGIPVRVIVSPAEILDMEENVLFLAVGFETTMAPIAATIEMVISRKKSNVLLHTALKRIPPTLEWLQKQKELNINGFILPGHVSTIIGSNAYQGLKVPGVIAGFEMVDILQAVLALLEMGAKKKSGVLNQYTRAVHSNGNPKARQVINKYFKPSTEPWRGLGTLPGCSLSLRSEYKNLDAAKKFQMGCLEDKMPKGCSCGEVLMGKSLPPDCLLFGNKCMPDHPVGPCMVSSEGACAAYFKYKQV